MSYAEVTTTASNAQLSDEARRVLSQLGSLPASTEAELHLAVERVSHSSGIAQESIARLLIAMAANIYPKQN